MIVRRLILVHYTLHTDAPAHDSKGSKSSSIPIPATDKTMNQVIVKKESVSTANKLLGSAPQLKPHLAAPVVLLHRHSLEERGQPHELPLAFVAFLPRQLPLLLVVFSLLLLSGSQTPPTLQGPHHSQPLASSNPANMTHTLKTAAVSCC